ncbi:gp53-like domain-containing protein [Campylobacter concisus]
MANLKEENKWEEGIYQLEVTDPVVGGIDGISNKQAKQLANRTKFLKESIDTLVDGKLGKEETAVDSDKLDGLDSSAFAQLAKENTFTKNLTIGSEGILHANNNDSHFLIEAKNKGQAIGLGTPKPDGSPVWHFFTHEGFKTDAGVNAGILKIKGVNTDEIYLKKDDDAFSNSKSENGYTRLPNGLIVQWGLALVEKGDNTTPTLFPIAFPNRCLNVTATHLGLDRNVSAIIVGGTMTAASVTFRHNWEHTATHISYLAIGY